MSSTRCLNQRYPCCTLCSTGNNVPLSGTTAAYLPKLPISREKMRLEGATSMLRRISNRKWRA